MSSPDRAVTFYEQAFGANCYFPNDQSAQFLGPRPTDVIALELNPKEAGKAGGIAHFGIRLTHSEQLEPVLCRALTAGGRLVERGDFGDDQPFAMILNPDGYEIELWHENTAHHQGD